MNNIDLTRTKRRIQFSGGLSWRNIHQIEPHYVFHHMLFQKMFESSLDNFIYELVPGFAELIF